MFIFSFNLFALALNDDDFCVLIINKKTVVKNVKKKNGFNLGGKANLTFEKQETVFFSPMLLEFIFKKSLVLFFFKKRQ